MFRKHYKIIFHVQNATKYPPGYWTLTEEESVEEAFYLKKKPEEKGRFDFLFFNAFLGILA